MQRNHHAICFFSPFLCMMLSWGRVRGTENVMSGRRPTINIELGPQHNNRPQQSHFYCRALLSDLLPLKEQLFVFMPFLLLLLHSFEILVVSLSRFPSFSRSPATCWRREIFILPHIMKIYAHSRLCSLTRVVIKHDAKLKRCAIFVSFFF